MSLSSSSTIAIERVDSGSGSDDGIGGHGSRMDLKGSRTRTRKRSRVLSNGRVVPKGVLEEDEEEEEEETAEEEEEEEKEPPSSRQTNQKSKPKTARIHTDDIATPRRSSLLHTPTSPTSRAWYEFDLAVVVALVSPIGNWLTGGDHIKNLLLVSLLIFYLHQIVEGIPFSLSKTSDILNKV